MRPTLHPNRTRREKFLRRIPPGLSARPSSPGEFHPEDRVAGGGFDVICVHFEAYPEVHLRSSLWTPHDVIASRLFRNVHHLGHWAEAAYGCLKPAPESRLRRLLKSPFLLQQLMLQPTLDTLLGHDVGACLAPADPPHMGTFARRAPTRGAGLAAPIAGAAAHSPAAVAAHADRPLALGPALAHLDRMANGTRNRQA